MTAVLLWSMTAVLVAVSADDHVSRQNSKKPNFIIFLMDDVRFLFSHWLPYRQDGTVASPPGYGTGKT